MKKRYRSYFSGLSRTLSGFGIALLLAGMIMSFVSQPVQARQETCPAGGEWIKKDNLSGKSFTFIAPEGKEIIEWCYKAGTNVTKGVVTTASTSYNMSSTVKNQNGQIQELSHVSFRIKDKSSVTEDLGSKVTATSNATPLPSEIKEDKKVTICHAAGLDGTDKYIVLNLSYNAVFKDQGGHFYENGTPQAGHEQDFLIENESDLARCQGVTTPTETQTITPSVTLTPSGTVTSTGTVTPSATVTPTAIVTETPTATASVTPSVTTTLTPSETVTATPPTLYDLEIRYVCRITEMDWIVTNPNNFEIEFTWIADPIVSAENLQIEQRSSSTGLVGSSLIGIAVAPANSDATVYFTSSVGNHTVSVSYVLPGSEPITLELSNGNDFCKLVETPDPSSTPVPTLQVPVSQSENILIPVTGLDLVQTQSGSKRFGGGTLINTGLIFLGIGLVLNGIFKK